MKVGDLVYMPGWATTPDGDLPSVGIIVADESYFPGDNSRIGVWWTGSGCIDYEPKDWLEVIKCSNT